MRQQLTRRQLIKEGGALAGALGALGAWPSGPRAALSTPLRKVIDIGPGGVIYSGSSAQDYRYFSNRRYFSETRTAWIRMWADWPSLQPDGAYAIDDARGPGYFRLQALDEQIREACADGLSVILMPYRYPPWANGTAALAAERNGDAEISFEYWDRMTEAEWNRYLSSGRLAAAYNPSRRALEYRIPEEGHGPASAWGRFFDFLYRRYHYGQRSSGRFVRAFELVNEPNLQIWPQHSPPADGAPFASTMPTIGRAVAQIMQSAQAISARYGHSTMMLAPSPSDSDTASSRRYTRYDAFVPEVLDALGAVRYRPHSMQAWSHHNYSDIEYRTAATRTQLVRGLLKGRWNGLVEGAAPTVFITEGGARITKMATLYPSEDARAAQAKCLQDAWTRHRSDSGAGAGVAMFAQYLLYADPNFDCGLLEPYPSTVHRPAYATWKSFPRSA